MNLEQTTNQILKKYNIKANKNLGQNFLIDDNVVSEIIESSDIQPTDLVIEIGPGLGVLTNEISKHTDNLILIELDDKMINILNDRFKDKISEGKIEILHRDVLKTNIDELVQDKKNRTDTQITGVKVIANLPYYITTPIITKLLEENSQLKNIIVMVQKEVAQRLIEKPGGKNTGTITYLVDYLTNSSKVIDVPKTSFNPVPKVDSQVIKLDILEEPKVTTLSSKILFKIIKVAFLQRRKTLVNNLVASNVFETKDEAKKVLQKLGINENIRPENMTLQDFAQLTDEYITSFRKGNEIKN